MAKGPLQAALDSAVKQAMKGTAERLDRRFREEIESEEWKFPTPPKVRDIVDTGRLRDSQVSEVTPDGVYEVRWTAPYAPQVHEGGVTTGGKRFPGRPWTRDPIAELPQIFSEELGQSLNQELNGPRRNKS